MKFLKCVRTNVIYMGGLVLATNLLHPQIVGILPRLLSKIYRYTCFPYLYLYMLGLYIYLYREWFIPKFARIWKITFVLYVIVYWGLGLDLRFSWTYINPISAILICITMFGLAYDVGKIRIRPDISFGIYLIHMPMIDLVRTIYEVASPAISLIVCWCGTIILAFFLNLSVEMRMNTLYRKLTKNE